LDDKALVLFLRIALLLFVAACLLRSDGLTVFPAHTFNSQVAEAEAEEIG
jgi:hypothetical protein